MSEPINIVSNFLNDINLVSIENDETINFNLKLKDLLDRGESTL